MELRHLRYFAAAGDLQHFGRAASLLHVAQPSLSRQIADLEAEVGVQLFERLPRGVRLSAAGRVFHDGVARLLIDLDRTVERARSAGRGLFGRFTLAFVESASWHGVFPEALAEFRALHPDVDLELVPMRSWDAHEALNQGRIDAALAYFCPDNPGWERLPAEINNVVVAFPRSHKMAKQRSLRLSSLADEPFVMYRRSSAPEYVDRVMAACNAAGFSPRITQISASEAAMLSFVSAGIGISIVTSTIAWRQPDNVVLRKVRGLSVPLRLELIWKAGDASPITRQFADILARRRQRRGAGPSLSDQ